MPSGHPHVVLNIKLVGNLYLIKLMVLDGIGNEALNLCVCSYNNVAVIDRRVVVDLFKENLKLLVGVKSYLLVCCLSCLLLQSLQARRVLKPIQ